MAPPRSNSNALITSFFSSSSGSLASSESADEARDSRATPQDAPRHAGGLAKRAHQGSEESHGTTKDTKRRRTGDEKSGSGSGTLSWQDQMRHGAMASAAASPTSHQRLQPSRHTLGQGKPADVSFQQTEHHGASRHFHHPEENSTGKQYEHRRRDQQHQQQQKQQQQQQQQRKPEQQHTRMAQLSGSQRRHDHVLLPCSESNAGKWHKIKSAMTNARSVGSVSGVMETILSYNETWRGKWDFGVLYDLLGDTRQRTLDQPGSRLVQSDDARLFWSVVWPFVTQMVLRTPSLFPARILLLRSNEQGTRLFTQEQVACVLANAFLCTWPGRNWQGNKSSLADFPSINFAPGLLCSPTDRKKRPVAVEKLRCFLSYFSSVARHMPGGNVSIHRRVVAEPYFPRFFDSTETLLDVEVFSEGTIEDAASTPMVHRDRALAEVDFANAKIGGGVLGSGCVQEEIRFLLSPECVVSRLICEKMAGNECIVIRGVDRYCVHEGYAGTFRYVGPYLNPAPAPAQRDSNGRSSVQIVAIDAGYYRNKFSQYMMQAIVRELRKAFTGFLAQDPASAPWLATGNWGAGAFGGDAELKFVIQAMAAAVCKRRLLYFTWGDTDLALKFSSWYSKMSDMNVSVATLYRALEQFCEAVRAHVSPPAGVLDWIAEQIETDQQHRANL